jgi:hypothetical protein
MIDLLPFMESQNCAGQGGICEMSFGDLKTEE